MHYNKEIYNRSLAALAALRKKVSTDERATIDFIAEAIAEKGDRERAMNNEDTISRAALLGIAEQQGCVTVDDIINAEAVPPQVTYETPCDLCMYDPPSSFDGKPCTMCPACAKMDGGENDAAD